MPRSTTEVRKVPAEAVVCQARVLVCAAVNEAGVAVSNASGAAAAVTVAAQRAQAPSPETASVCAPAEPLTRSFFGSVASALPSRVAELPDQPNASRAAPANGKGGAMIFDGAATRIPPAG